MSAHLEVGDFVQLRSGGPTMMIDGFDEVGGFICSYFDGVEFKRSVYRSSDLKVIDSSRHASHDGQG